MLPSSSVHTPAMLLNTENATPNAPPTCTGNAAGDTIPGGAGAALAMSATGNAKTPLRTSVPFANSRNPPSVSVYDTYSISPVNPLNDEKALLTRANDPRSATGCTAIPVTTTWSSLFMIPNAFSVVGRLIANTVTG